MNTIGVLPPTLILFSFLLPIIDIATKDRKKVRILGTLGAAVAFGFALNNLIAVVMRGKPITYKMGGWPPPIGIVYEVDNIGAFFAAVTAALILLITIYSTWYMKGYRKESYYYAFLLTLEAGLIGIYYTGDVFNLFVMIEVASIASYVLVSFYSNKEAIEAALKYTLFGLVAGLIYFLACILIYSSFGTLSMGFIAGMSRLYTYESTDILSFLIWGNITGTAALVLALCAWSFTFFSGTFPNHFWLPDAHPAAPTPISAALSGLVVNAGIYCFIRFLYTIFGVFDTSSLFNAYASSLVNIFTAIGAFSMIFGALMMIIQRDVKRLIAYSTIVHMSLILIAVSTGIPLGLKGAVYHIITHSIAKSALFLSVGIVIKLAGTRNLDELPSLARKDPVIALSTLISCLSLIGVPPFIGFFSKLTLYKAFLSLNSYWLIASLFLATGISLLGYFKIVHVLLFNPMSREVYTKYIGQTYSLRAQAVLLTLSLALIILNPLVINEALDLVIAPAFDSSSYIREALTAYTLTKHFG